MKRNLLFIPAFCFLMLVLPVSCINQENTQEAPAFEQTQSDTALITPKPKPASVPETDHPEPFVYVPAVPVGGALKGVIELGTSGFNYFIVDIDNQKRWQLKKPKFGNSFVMEGMITPAKIRETVTDYIQEMISFGVPGKYIYFVVSSGAASSKVVQSSIEVLRSLGYIVHPVTAEQEAIYAFDCLMPEIYRDSAFVVDMGSYNTKISYWDGMHRIGKETYGAKYFQLKTDSATVAAAVSRVVAEVPEDRRKYCFIIGGIPFQLASAGHGTGRYTVLSANAAAYHKLIKDEGEKMRCGLNIYSAILKTSGCKRTVFDKDANFVIGYLLSTTK